MRFVRPWPDWRCARISARGQLLDLVVWAIAAGLAGVAAAIDDHRFLSATKDTAAPFLVLGLVLMVGLTADRLGLFRAAAGVVIPARAPPPVVADAVLVYTAMVSGLVNLDVAVVVAVPVALSAATRSGVSRARMVLATTLTANATAFLLPTSNLTTLLVLSRSPLPLGEYLKESWAAWLLVTVVTVSALSLVASRKSGDGGTPTPEPGSRSAVHTLLALVPMYAGASAMRALLGAVGVQLSRSFARAAVASSLLAAALNNLPVAAVVRPEGGASQWAAILALSIGPNLIVTGSIATLIARQLARIYGTTFSASEFTLMGAILVPVQLSAALVGLRLTGAL